MSKVETKAFCPHCEQTIREIDLQRLDVDNQMGAVGAGYPTYIAVTTCPHCNKILTAVPL
jgi:hypothetical protein